ncbi:1-acyl-sn-glycerol-3-phosphate acyltransferase [Microlunatus panaciterrae]|uniref:1-acyl-sn-glycerol-3-phosphate acyltransferase n=1 Tax=Microlunatus panaciterrae TaxID=400768 RepID=A0ABS2RNH8_9ACTN|nr:lysophospholipid acyltransferase family protein [Microlunatus panaciterrae]MBM7800564.1 1-acyl-sn-glycerol-3-phosphate acyltransferase [Microlunatus panaciterrae]
MSDDPATGDPTPGRTSRPVDRRKNVRLRPLRKVISEPAEPTLFWVVWLLNEGLKRFTLRDWRNQEKIPKTGGAVLVVNHVSNIDPVVFGQYLVYAGRWPRFLGKASLFRIPVIGRIITACGQIPVERDTRNAAVALQQAVVAVLAGKCVSIYPEGTITLDPDLWPMTGRHGAARIAFATGCPVIPVGQWGSQEIMYGKQIHFPKLLPRKTLILKAGDPVDLDDLREQQLSTAVLDEATDRIMNAITAIVAELRGEEPPPVRFDARRQRRTKGQDR